VGRQAGRGQPGWKVDLIDLAELPLAINLGASAGTAELASRISDTAAILLVTCEYNHRYPASPKFGSAVRRSAQPRPRQPRPPTRRRSTEQLSGGLPSAPRTAQLVTADARLLARSRGRGADSQG
jgi:hypothetical protein